MNLDLCLDSLVVMTTSGPRQMIEPSTQFMSEVNCLTDRSNL